MRARRPHDIRHALVTDAVALLSHSGGNDPQRLSLRPQGDHFPDRLLLELMRDEFAIVAAPETKWHDPAEVSATGLLIGLHLPDSLADAVALSLSEGGSR
jgi:hypothetical protein